MTMLQEFEQLVEFNSVLEPLRELFLGETDIVPAEIFNLLSQQNRHWHDTLQVATHRGHAEIIQFISNEFNLTPAQGAIGMGM